MIVYNPCFTDHWSIEELDTNNIRLLTPGISLDKYGTIRNSFFYKTRESAAKYIAKEYIPDTEVVRIENKTFIR